MATCAVPVGIPVPNPQASSRDNREAVQAAALQAYQAELKPPTPVRTPPTEKPVGECEIAAVSARRAENISLNLMVVGESSLGKTTATDSMFRRHTSDDAQLRHARHRDSKQAKIIATQMEEQERVLQQLQSEFKENSSNFSKSTYNAEEYQALAALRTKINAIKEQLNVQRSQLEGQRAEDLRALQQIEDLKKSLATLQEDISSLQGLVQAGHDLDEQSLERMRELKIEEGRQQDQVNSLMRTWKDAFEFTHRHSSGGASDTVINPRTMCIEERAAFDIPSGNKLVRVTVTDTKGFGDDMDANVTIAPIKEEILARHKEHKRKVESCQLVNKKEDRLIHVCLYFIRPHRLSGIDKQFMRELSPLVNIIPIIAKADSMSVPELSEFKKSIKSDLHAEGIECYQFASKAAELVSEEEQRIRHLLGNSTTLLEECPQIDTSSVARQYKLQEPFAVIASDHRDMEQDVRTYPFGTAKGTNPLHSDFPSLCELTINRGPEYLRDSAMEKFAAWALQENKEEEARVADAARFEAEQAAMVKAAEAACVEAEAACVAAEKDARREAVKGVWLRRLMFAVAVFVVLVAYGQGMNAGYSLVCQQT